MKTFSIFPLALFLLIPVLLTAEEPPASGPHNPIWIEGTTFEDQGSPYADLAESISPAVVNVLVIYDEESRPPLRSSIPGSDALAQGSGFIIHPDGHLITNFHVIDRAARIRVRLHSEAEFEATVVGVDPDTDLALLKVQSPQDLPAVPLGASFTVRPGDSVIAIGNPLGLTHSVTAGIISAVGRRDLPIEGNTHQGQFIQTDAPINPGNSGGPLINMRGEVIGVNTAVNRQGQGISFAIPIDTVKTLLPQLQRQGYVERSWLGVRIQPIDLALATTFGRPDARGALITEVLPDSPAARAGLNERDLILRLDNYPIDRSDVLPWIVSTTPGGTEVSLRIVRDGEELTLPVELAAIPNQDPPALPGGRGTHEEPGGAGFEVTELTTRLARQLSTPNENGVVVSSFTEASSARQAGLRHRDVIVELGATPIENVEAFEAALATVEDGELIRIKVLRQGRSLYMAFTK